MAVVNFLKLTALLCFSFSKRLKHHMCIWFVATCMATTRGTLQCTMEKQELVQCAGRYGLWKRNVWVFKIFLFKLFRNNDRFPHSISYGGLRWVTRVYEELRRITIGHDSKLLLRLQNLTVYKI